MTTRLARALLGCTKTRLYRAHRQGDLKYRLVAGKIDWDDADLRRLAGLPPGPRYTVLYCRTEPAKGLENAEVRLAVQKQRLIDYCVAKGWEPDVVIGEVRRVNRVRNVNNTDSNGLNILFQMIADKQVERLVLETRDRLIVGPSWELFQRLLNLQGTDVHVINQVWPTTESREESINWMTDILAVHKVLAGEIHDKVLAAQFMGGLDLGTAQKQVRALHNRINARDAEVRRREKAGHRRVRDPVDLAELFPGAEGPARSEALLSILPGPELGTSVGSVQPDPLDIYG